MRFIIMFLFCSPAFADQGWLCEDSSVQKQGNVYYSCGVFDDQREVSARHYALKFARKEFEEICEMSADCAKFPVIVEPMRMNCKEVHQPMRFSRERIYFKCYQLLKITVQNGQ